MLDIIIPKPTLTDQERKHVEVIHEVGVGLFCQTLM